MKLDTRNLRYLTAEDWRVLTAVEIGSRNHEVVPTPLIKQISNTSRSDGNMNKHRSKGGASASASAGGGGSGGGSHKSISTLAKANLIARTKNASYDGYRLTYGGLDYLALHAHMKQSTLYSTGPCIGSGKESDIYVCADPKGIQHVLKIHRLGRISFRSVKNNRDYLRHRSSASWMYMSRLAAQKEFVFMKALGENGFRVPRALAQNRHAVVMELVEGVPLRVVKKVGDPAGLYGELIEVILRLARFGLIHGDFNEFNIMVRDEEASPTTTTATADEATVDTDVEATARIKPVIIDFPQMVSIDHQDAEYYFNRDVNCLKTFFERRFHFVSEEPGPFLADVKGLAGRGGSKRLDVEVEASGFSKKMAKELEKYMRDIGVADGQGEAGEELSDEAETSDGASVSHGVDGLPDEMIT